jgi:hypothetical protein
VLNYQSIIKLKSATQRVAANNLRCGGLEILSICALLSACGGGAFGVGIIISSVDGIVVGNEAGNEPGAGSFINSAKHMEQLSISINKINHANKRNPVLSKQNLRTSIPSQKSLL